MENLSSRQRFIFRVLAFFVGIIAGTMILFNILFLMKVLPHAGF